LPPEILIRIMGRDELLKVVSEKPMLSGYEHSATTQKGFTGHEMLDDLGLIHMGGRVYDPTLARFLSTDPVVQQPHNLQNYNRYSYVLNNPVSYTDPTGYLVAEIAATAAIIVGTAATVAAISAPYAALWYGAREVGRLAAKNKFGGELLQIAVVAGCIAATSGAGTPACIALASGWAATAVALGNGASNHEALRFGLRTAAVAYVAATVAGGIGDATSGGGWPNTLAKAYGHGVNGAWAAGAMGGDVNAGFTSGVLGSLVGGYIHDAGLDPGTGAMLTGMASGIASRAAGGKFEHGFLMGAVTYLFNHHAHANKKAQYVFGDQVHSDEQVVSFIQDSLNAAEGDIFSAWSDLYSRRFGGENPDPTNVNLAAAEHYMFARDITGTKWWGGLSMAGAVPAKTAWKYIRPIFGIENQSQPSLFEVKWGNQGTNDGTFDRGFPDILGQKCSACQYQGR
jgi:RHS repeat-associated protein